MGFFRKKIELFAFLVGRIPQFGWAQLGRGLRERPMAYTAMELASVLPPTAATIVDVGGHDGTVADALDFLYRPRRLWVVEPNPAKGAGLDLRFAGRTHVEIAQVCLGETIGTVTFKVHDFDAASSLYDCKPGHLASLGFAEGSAPVPVPMRTLADLLPADLMHLDLLMLDCQGSELAVLKGAKDRIRTVRWILTEVSIDPIYAEAPLFGDLHAFLVAHGFELRRMCGFAGRAKSIQWADALYANTQVSEQTPP